MPTCAICDRPIDGPPLTDDETATVLHPACAADRLAGDLAVAGAALAAALLARLAVVWAG
jgi:hypothetical protein